MKYQRIVVSQYGGPDVLHVVEEEVPEPRPDEVRVKILAAGVGMPDIMAREGIHPETPRVPFTPGWDLVGVVERLGDQVSDFNTGQVVAAMPISSAYAEYQCLKKAELIPVPLGLDPAETVSLLLNYVTAYQMLTRSAKVKSGQRILIHGATGGVGTALLQLGRVLGLTMYGTCSSKGAPTVTDLGGTPIDYGRKDLVQEVLRVTGDGVDTVFDPFGGAHMWQSRQLLRVGGKVVAYGTTTTLRAEGLGSKRSGKRNPLHGIPIFGLYIAGGLLLPGKRRIVPYSIQWLKRLRPALFREDAITLIDLLRRLQIKPIVAHRFPLSQARQAQELLAKGGVIGKIVLVSNELKPEKSTG
ncbi:MAG: zinc-binding dehydrogenase [Planctomycetes bacterium]|nr:zinc-binding dehydrogenase [Planctomycetota bacterium]